MSSISDGLLAQKAPATAITTYINVVKNVVGSGMMALPYAVSCMGIALATIMACVSLTAACLSVWLMAHSADAVRAAEGDAGNYFGLVSAAGGPTASKVAAGVLAWYTVFMLIAYSKLMVDFFGTGLGALGAPPLVCHAEFILCTAAVMLVPLCSTASIGKLKSTSIFGNLVILYTVGIIVGSWISSGASVASSVVEFGSGARVFQGFPILALAWNFHYNIPVYYAELGEGRSPRLMMNICAAAYTTIGLCYLTVCSAGYLRYGEQTVSNIINNLPSDETAVQVCRLLLGVMVIFTYPIVAFSARANIAKCLASAGELSSDWQRILMALGLVLLSSAVSMRVPNVGVVASLNGATFGMAQQLIIPALLALRLSSKGVLSLPPYGRGAAIVMLVWGSFVGIVGLIGTIITILNGQTK